MKKCFAEADTGERMFCESKHMKGHMMKVSLLTHVYWSTLHCTGELYLLGLHRKKCTKKTSGGVLQSLMLFPRTQADWMHMLKQEPC